MNQSSRFIKTMRWLFAVLFYGQILLPLLIVVLVTVELSSIGQTTTEKTVRIEREVQSGEALANVTTQPNPQLNRMIDSTRKAGTHSVETRESYFIGVVLRGGTPLKTTPPRWETPVQNAPGLTIVENVAMNEPYRVQVNLRSWRDLQAYPWFITWLTLLKLLTYFGAFLTVTYWIKRCFDDVAQRLYFHDVLARRMNRVGWLCIGLFVGQFVIDLVQQAHLRQYLYETKTTFTEHSTVFLPDNYSYLLIGLVFLLVGQVFQYGTQLQHEQELTI